MSTYMVRKIDNDLMRAAKAKATADQISIRSLFVWLLQLYVRHGLTGFEALGGRFPRG